MKNNTTLQRINNPFSYPPVRFTKAVETVIDEYGGGSSEGGTTIVRLVGDDQVNGIILTEESEYYGKINFEKDLVSFFVLAGNEEREDSWFDASPVCRLVECHENEFTVEICPGAQSLLPDIDLGVIRRVTAFARYSE